MQDDNFVKFAFLRFGSVQFSSVQDITQALGNAHRRSAPSLGSVPSVTFETIPMLIRLTMALSRPFEGRLSTAAFFCASLLHVISGA